MEMKFNGMDRSIVGVDAQVKSAIHDGGRALSVPIAHRENLSRRPRDPDDFSARRFASHERPGRLPKKGWWRDSRYYAAMEERRDCQPRTEDAGEIWERLQLVSCDSFLRAKA